MRFNSGKVNDCPDKVNVSSAAVRQPQSHEKRKKPVPEHMSRTGYRYRCRLKPIENQRYFRKNNRTPVSIKPDVLLWLKIAISTKSGLSLNFVTLISIRQFSGAQVFLEYFFHLRFSRLVGIINFVADPGIVAHDRFNE